MRKTIILIFFVCVICSTLCFGEESNRKVNSQAHFIVSKITENDFPKIFRPIGDLFRKIFRKERIIREYNTNVTNLILSFTEITAECPIPRILQKENCSNIKVVTVFAVAKDPEGDSLIYAYEVTGGKIVGIGEKIVWDLSGVNPGIYKITAQVDDGCGYCGIPMTKTVTVKVCPDCKDE